jgi:hypothetical protein
MICTKIKIGTKKDAMQKDVMKKLQRKKSGMTDTDGEDYLRNNPKKIGCQNKTNACLTQGLGSLRMVH